jgi:hypothetical protein
MTLGRCIRCHAVRQVDAVHVMRGDSVALVRAAPCNCGETRVRIDLRQFDAPAAEPERA